MRKILLLLLIAVTVSGVGLGLWLNNPDDAYNANVTFDLSQTSQKEVSFALSGLHPGSVQTTELYFVGGAGETFSFTCEFIAGETNTLAPYIYVEFLSDEQVLAGADLADYLGGRVSAFTLNTDLPLQIRYTMSAEAGNEAQGTIAQFQILLKMER